jgi:hypothetical protein
MFDESFDYSNIQAPGDGGPKLSCTRYIFVIRKVEILGACPT